MRANEDTSAEKHPAVRKRRKNTLLGSAAISVGLGMAVMIAWRDQLNVLSFSLVIFLLLFGGYIWDAKEFGALIREMLKAAVEWRKK
jgi:hypothetical protein